MFNKLAEAYRDKFMGLTLYDDSYREFCGLLKPGRTRVMDAACGPGNAAPYVLAQRPEVDSFGIDLAPRMVELARAAVAAARFAAHGRRHLAELRLRFHGIICAFGLPYLSSENATAFIRTASEILDPNGVLFLSAISGRSEDSGFERCSPGDQVYLNYHSEQQVVPSLQACGLRLVKQSRLPSPSAAAKKTINLSVIAQK